MSDKLKKFVGEHRQEFDSTEPGKDLWEKIDAQLDVKRSSRISSKWALKFVYLGFSASVLVVSVYIITKDLNNPVSHEPALNRKDPLMSNSKKYLETYQNLPGSNTKEDNAAKVEINDLPKVKNEYQHPIPVSSNDIEQDLQSANDSFPGREMDHGNSADEKKGISLAVISKKASIYVPAEPEKVNNYTGTLYEGSSICEVLRVYKFPGKVSLDGGMDIHRDVETSQNNVRTISCNHLENMINMKAIWFKGKTDKKIALAVKRGFKNIVLVKSDGRVVNPEAISHYYASRMVISDYKGKYFNLVFKDKVGLILFFKDAEEGDKIIINGIIEAVVKNIP